MAAVRQEEQLVRSLLAPLERIEPATLAARRSRHERDFCLPRALRGR
jgi:hypothetical protein